MQRFRLTYYFALTALVVMTSTTIGVNLLGGRLAEENLTRLTGENTARDGAHIQSMLMGHHSMNGMPSGEGAAGNGGMQRSRQSMPLTLEFLTSPEGLSPIVPSLLEGLLIVKFNLFDLDGKTVWSTDPGTLGITKRERPLFQEAAVGGISSKLAKDHDVVGLNGVIRRIDVVETYMPLRETPSGQLIGVMEIYRDVSTDYAIQVTDTKARVLRLTVGTMGGLCLVFLSFIVVADVIIHRANRREVSLVEDQLADRERAEEALRQSEEAATRLADANAVLAEIGRIISSSLDIEQVYERFAEQVRKLIPFDRIVITVLDHERGTATATYAKGADIPGWHSGNTHVMAGTVTGAVVRTRSGLILGSESAEATADRFPDEAIPAAAGLRSMIAVPLIGSDRVMATMTIRSRSPNAYS